LLAHDLLQLVDFLLLLCGGVLRVYLEAVDTPFDKLVHPFLDVGLLKVISPAEIDESDLAFDDVKDRISLTLTGPALEFDH
jgi:hypothetical protein